MLPLLLIINLSNKLRKTIDPLSLETFNHAPDHVFESPVLSHISSLSPFTIPFLDRLDDILSGAIPLSTFVQPQFWYNWFIYTWEQDPGHLLLEVLCVGIILYLWHRRPYDPKDDERLSPQEEEELIRAWKPEPLAAPPPPNLALRATPIVSSYSHQHVTIAGKQYVNWVSTNWLGVSSLQRVKDACRETIEKYGVGSCGPRGFYGSFDLHLEVEKRLAEFFGGEACILYSDAIATMSSVIPAFSKRGDLIVCDEGCHFGIQQGIRLSRSNVLYYKHNDMDDLERILHQVQEKDMRGHSGSKLNRRFIITEGISSHHGTITPLPHIVRLKQRYKYRLILDDTMAVGVLGATGRGSLEQWAVDVEQCDMYCASMEAAFASVGGFCIGSKQVVDHQRLSGAGYCFPEVDTRVLTDSGFLFLREIEARVDRDEVVLYGCYDIAKSTLVYRPGKLKYFAPPARWVDFTQAATRPLWDATSTDYGAAPGQRRQANYFTLRTTPGHDMYVQLSSRLGGSDRALAPRKLRAKELAPGFTCKSSCKNSNDCPHGYAAYRFFNSPASGVDVKGKDIMSIRDTARDSPVVRLGLRTDDQLNAFLELYGYWLGYGSMSFDSATTGALLFIPKKERDFVYVRNLLERLPLQPQQDWTSTPLINGSLTFRVKSQRWVFFFDEEYGRTKYFRSRSRRAGASPASPATDRRNSSSSSSTSSFSSSSGSSSPTSSSISDSLSFTFTPRGRSISATSTESMANAIARAAEMRSCVLCDSTERLSLDKDSGLSYCDGCTGDVIAQASASTDSWAETDEPMEPASSTVASGHTAESGQEGVNGTELEEDDDEWKDESMEIEDEELLLDVVKKEEQKIVVDLLDGDDVLEDEQKEDDDDDEEEDELLDEEEEEDGPREIKSAKWFWSWAFTRLSKEQMGLVIEGLRQADGVSARTKRQKAAGTAFSGLQRIYTSSVEFRDELIQACLHAGFTAHFTINTRAGTVRGYNSVPSDYRIYSREEMELLLRADPSRVFKPVQARHDNWAVHYSLNSSWLSADEVRFDGKAMTLKEQRKMSQGFVAVHVDGRVERTATQAQLAAKIGCSQRSVGRRVRGAQSRCLKKGEDGWGWKCYIADEYDRRQSGATAAAPAATELADAYSLRDGRTWCVDVEHDDHLIFAQRAHRNAAGIVTKAGLPIITGNCFSASSPPYTVTAALKAIEYIDERPELSSALRDKATALRKLLSNLPGLQLVGKQTDAISPLIHLVLREGSGSREDDEALLLKIANKVYSEDGMLVHVPEYIAGERQMPPASLQVSVTVEHEEKEMEKLAKALKKAAQEVLALTTTNGKK